eukprot:NODE_407_length_9242_cov_0.441868.p9 type:complete len:104 gc:universal NODE_407_length_9242_cov_0.441868:3719-3408(-)
MLVPTSSFSMVKSFTDWSLHAAAASSSLRVVTRTSPIAVSATASLNTSGVYPTLIFCSLQCLMLIWSTPTLIVDIIFNFFAFFKSNKLLVTVHNIYSASSIYL